MSVKLMSAIFETEFRDLIDEAGNVTKASTAKLVLLALADHANDDGEGAYPGLTKMEKKTALTRHTIINTYDALKYNGVIFLEGTSKLGTNNYTINTKSFPKMLEDASEPILLVNRLDYPSVPISPPLVNPLHPNHPLTTNKPEERDTQDAVFVALANLTGGGLNSNTPKFVDTWREKHTDERILQAVQVARENKARSVKYVDEVLVSWEANGYPKTREQRINERKQKTQPAGYDAIRSWLKKEEAVNG